MMNSCVFQQQQKMNALAGYGGEIRRGDSPFDGVVCPKPRRPGLFFPFIDDYVRPPRFHQHQPTDYHTEVWESKIGAELDILLSKGSHGPEKLVSQVASSPPFFCGSPPTRASNPVIQDARFGGDKVSSLSLALKPSPSPSSSATHNNGGLVCAKYGQNPAMRIEGFNCQGISAVA